MERNEAPVSRVITKPQLPISKAMYKDYNSIFCSGYIDLKFPKDCNLQCRSCSLVGNLELKDCQTERKWMNTTQTTAKSKKNIQFQKKTNISKKVPLSLATKIPASHSCVRRICINKQHTKSFCFDPKWPKHFACLICINTCSSFFQGQVELREGALKRSVVWGWFDKDQPWEPTFPQLFGGL